MLSASISPTANADNSFYYATVDVAAYNGAPWYSYNAGYGNTFQTNKTGPVKYSASNFEVYRVQGTSPGGVPPLSLFTNQYLRVRLFPVWLNPTAYCEIFIDAGNSAQAPRIVSFANYGQLQ